MDKILLLLVLHVSLVFSATAPPPTIFLSGVIRDQAPNTFTNISYGGCGGYGGTLGTANGGLGFANTDFEILPVNSYAIAEKGLVGVQCNAANWQTCGTLGADNTPVYAYPGASPGQNVHSPASFYTWFHDSNQTINVPINITLTWTGGNTTVYSYSNLMFFPIDGKGWNDRCNAPYNHNFAFCMEVHSRFQYSGGEVFNFLGDDDVWVYINRKLVLDLGGLHPMLQGSILLDTIPDLVKGQIYPFDFFYCERHSTQSDIQISTSLNLFCEWYDWCGVCEGNGQSCCTPGLCDDHNSCTVDSCPVLSAPNATNCVHTPVTCAPATNPCSISLCDPTVGCTTVPKACTDGSACTADSCNPTNGVCQFTPINCDDQNSCTADSCAPATGCQHTAISCDDANKCTTDSCDALNGCQHALISCDDANVCTSDLCSATLGCQHTAISCDDANACTTDSCSATLGCQHTSLLCNDNNACTADSCNGSSGCVFTQLSCDDNNKCTNDVCDSTTGCTSTPVNCDDGNACTTDSCNAATGCLHKAVQCAAPDACSTATCSPNTGCKLSPIICDDSNACTTNYCNATIGCVFTAVKCDDANACTTDSCNAATGCTHTLVNCDDNNPCTTDSCSAATGCAHTPIVCNDSNACTVDSCSASTGCLYTPLSCDDANSCTVDTCNAATGCKHIPVVCYDDNVCTTDVCDAQTGCKFVTIACNDQSACTVDTCNATTGCVYTPVKCDDGNACTTDSCNAATGCTRTLVICDDKNACTTDTCNSASGCAHTQVACNDNSACTADSCDKVLGCQFTNITCSSGGAVTCDLVYCDPASGCHYSPVVDAFWDNVLLNSWTDATGLQTQWNAILRTGEIPLYSVTFSISGAVYGIWNAGLRDDGLYTLPVWQYQDGIIPAHSSYVTFGYTISGPNPATISLSSGICAPEYTGCTVQVSNLLVNSWIATDGTTVGQYNLLVTNVGTRVIAHVNVTISPPGGELYTSWNLIPYVSGEYECQLWNLYPGQASQACGYNVNYTASAPTFDVANVNPLCI